MIFTFIQIFHNTKSKLFKVTRSKQLNNGKKILYIRSQVKNILNSVSG